MMRTSTIQMLPTMLVLTLLTGCASAPPPPQPIDQANQFRTMWDDIYENLKPEIQQGHIIVERGKTLVTKKKLTSLDRSHKDGQTGLTTGPQGRPAPKLDGTVALSASSSSDQLAAGAPQYREYIRVRLSDHVLFESGEDHITPEGVTVLSRLGKILKDEKDVEIAIHGHTDNVPIRERLKPKFSDNMALSQARASNAAQILQHNGVAQHALVLKWFGESHPVAANDSDDNRRKNRRVEIMITPKEGP